MNVEELEMLRKKAKNRFIIGVLAVITLSVIVLYITKIFALVPVCIILGTLVTVILSYKPAKKFTLAFKECFVLKSLKSVFTDIVYEPERGIDEKIIRNTQMMYMGDRYLSNDYIAAKYKNVNFVQADIQIEEKHETTDSDGNERIIWETIFKGKWMIFDFNKEFKSNLQVLQKGFRNSKITNFGQALKYRKVKTEDQLFNNKFKIYAQSEHEAFYILTPALMEKIKKLVSMVNGKIILCFIDNKLHIGIENNKDSFEHSIFKKINEERIVEEISKDIKLITNFVDELDLDNNLFRGEGKV